MRFASFAPAKSIFSPRAISSAFAISPSSAARRARAIPVSIARVSASRTSALVALRVDRAERERPLEAPRAPRRRARARSRGSRGRGAPRRRPPSRAPRGRGRRRPGPPVPRAPASSCRRRGRGVRTLVVRGSGGAGQRRAVAERDVDPPARLGGRGGGGLPRGRGGRGEEEDGQGERAGEGHRGPFYQRRTVPDRPAPLPEGPPGPLRWEPRLRPEAGSDRGRLRPEPRTPETGSYRSREGSAAGRRGCPRAGPPRGGTGPGARPPSGGPRGASRGR